VRGEIIAGPLGLEFEVLDADPRRVKKTRIHRVAANTDAQESAKKAEPQE
jgi:CBS domain containing-hemolysin-like protein